jgi:hypothetical protein
MKIEAKRQNTEMGILGLGSAPAEKVIAVDKS